MQDEMSDFTKVHTLTNQFEADVLSDALKQAEIPVIVRPFRETAYAEIFVTQKGWGWIMVPHEFEDRAKNIIQSALEDFEAKPLYSDPLEIDPALWKELREANPKNICAYSGTAFSEEAGFYLIPFFNTHLLCFPEQEKVDLENPDIYPVPDFELYLVTLTYLLRARKLEPSGQWIGEKEIPGGEQFFRGLHQFPFGRLLKRFGPDTALLERAARSLGATPVSMGDAAFAFQAFPRVPIALLMWEGDEEFPAAMHLRFDETISKHLPPLDVIWALANVTCRALDHAGQRFLDPEPGGSA